MKKMTIILACMLACFILFTGCTDQKGNDDDQKSNGNSGVEVDMTDEAYSSDEPASSDPLPGEVGNTDEPASSAPQTDKTDITDKPTGSNPPPNKTDTTDKPVSSNLLPDTTNNTDEPASSDSSSDDFTYNPKDPGNSDSIVVRPKE